jgi:hypothetical protein
VVDYVGNLIYHDGKLVSIDTPEGRAVPLDSTNQDFTYQFFYNDHLGNLRVAYSVAPNGAIITQENHFGPTGELLEGLGTAPPSGGQTGLAGGAFYPYLFQGKEREFSWGLGLDDFMTRTYDPLTGRMWQVDGADQFASGYVGMGNNAVNGTDPDGQFFQYIIGAALGGYSGYKIGKAQGATGWALAGYALAGAGIGAISVGAGEAVLGSFSFAAQAGVSAGSSMLAYGAAGAASGFVGGAGMAGLSGGDVWQGGLNGAFWGGIGGALGGYLKHNAFENSLFDVDNHLAGPGGKLYSGGTLKEVVVRGIKTPQSGAIKPSYFFEDFFVGGAITKPIGAMFGALFSGAASSTSSSILNFTSRQLQAKFKHAIDFGVAGNYSRANSAKLSAAINQHINSAGTQIIQGTYRNAANPVTFYLNPKTGLNVISTPSGQFISGAKLSKNQVNDILTRAFLW